MNRRDFIKICAASALIPQTDLFANQTVQGKEIYITIDDGWFFTKEIIDMANHYKVPLNMFIIGQIVQKDPAFWAKAVEQGHMLGSHTYYHPKFSRTDNSSINTDFKTYESTLKNKIGSDGFKKITYFRYPYGNKGNSANQNEIKKHIEDYGWKVSWWTHDVSFYSGKYGVSAYKDPNNQLKDFVANIKPVNVPLFHFKDPDRVGLEKIIQYGLENGYKFKRLDEQSV